MIKIYCDICGQEPKDQDFAFEANKTEIVVSISPPDMTPRNQMRKEMIQICKGCYYKHLSKLFEKNGKEKTL